jgi:hypothetical protein
MNLMLLLEGERPLAVSKRFAKLAATCIVSCVTAGCAILSPVPPEDTVRKLATQRWQALLAGKYDQAYEMLNPAYRKLKSKEQYAIATAAGSVRWKSAEVVRVDCEPKKCVVTIKAVSEIRMPTFFKAPLVSGLDEVWIFEEGQWWKLEKL